MVAVDGIETDESNLIKLIQGNNVIGSLCNLTIVRSRGGSAIQSEPRSEAGSLPWSPDSIRDYTRPSVQPAEVIAEIIAARDLPALHATGLTDAFVCLSVIDKPLNTNIQSILGQNFAELDHAPTKQGDSSTIQCTWKRSESGRHLIKHALDNQPDLNNRLKPQVRTRVMERTLDPCWNETFILNESYSDALAHRQQHFSLDSCPVHDVHGQELMALVTLHGRLMISPSKDGNQASEDGWCGRLLLPNICAGQSIDGWFPLEQADGSPVIG